MTRFRGEQRAGMTKGKNMKYIDAGINLFSNQFSNKENVIKEANNSDIGCILISNSMKEVHSNINFIKKHSKDEIGKNIRCTTGIHPHNAKNAVDADFETIKKLASSPSAVAVGECGLDYDRMFSDKKSQLLCFEKQIQIAEELDLPLYLHERAAVEDFIKTMKKHPDICKKSIVHCFTGKAAVLREYVNMGFHIGITGWIADDARGKDLRKAVELLPLDRVIIETDSPFLKPKCIKDNNINFPTNVPIVARELAKYMNCSEEELTSACLENTLRLFRF